MTYCNFCIPGAPLSTLCNNCKDFSQETHNKFLDKWVHIEQQSEEDIKNNLIERNIEWLTNDHRCLLQSFVQMPGDLIPRAADLQNLYKHLAQIMVGVPVENEIYCYFRPYHYLLGNINDIPTYYEEDISADDFEWVRSMLGYIEDTEGIPEDLFQNEEETAPRRQTVRIQVKQGIECAVCYEDVNYERCVSFQCNHMLCMYCVKRLIQDTSKAAVCPMCREEIKTIEVTNDWVADELSH